MFCVCLHREVKLAEQNNIADMTVNHKFSVSHKLQQIPRSTESGTAN